MNEFRKLRTGIFIPPHHPIDEDPTLCMERDLELTEWAEHLGYDEVWYGEHHSGGYELIGSPELFIATAAARTKRIKLGTGVVSLPYHNPFMVAQRFVQLDHLTRGRAMLGCGPGLLILDAMMLGVPPKKSRERMEESLEIILRLLAGETVNHESEWITLRDARLHLLPYTRPRPHVAVASAVTPNGAYLAGRYGLGMLCVTASLFAGYDVLGVNWDVACKTAAEHGRTMDRQDLRVVTQIHLAETREEAINNCKWGFDKYQDYMAALYPDGGRLGKGGLEEVISRDMIVIGTPDDAIEFLEKYWEKTGGFGTLLMFGINWAKFEATKRSYELFARYVRPKFEGRMWERQESLDYMRANAEDYGSQRKEAAKETVEKRFSDVVPRATTRPPV